MNVPELLAPVGSREALAAAVQNGADAVYLGGKLFSARQYADNFDNREMAEAVEYAHIRGVKVYVTVNTLVSDDELPEAVNYLKFLHRTGLDAILVQDLGLIRLSRELLPGLALHASTQMTIHNSSGAELLKNMGISRVVLARELSLAEIQEITQKTGVETEVFVHGALCVSYSGQCLMSSMIGGRSGNRGRCAQPCRMEYALVGGEGKVLADPEQAGSHLLSPRDLNMIKFIPVLAETGVSSLKIEGRMKRPEYVATVTRVYREALDRFRENPGDYSVSDKDLRDLAQIFNRGFTTGYFFGRQGRDMMSFKRPSNRGLRLGRVTGNDRAGGMLEIALEDTLRRGDGIEFWVTEGGRKGITVGQILIDGNQVEEAEAGQKVWIKAEGKIRTGDRVFKTHDIDLISRAEQSYRSARELKKIPVDFTVKARVGEPLEITVTDHDGFSNTARSGFLGQEAVNKPLTKDFLGKQLDRLGNTPFGLRKLDTVIDENVMVPVSEINETRRRVLEGLAEARAAGFKPKTGIAPDFDRKREMLFYHPGGYKDCQKGESRVPRLTVRTDRLELVRVAAQSGADQVCFGALGVQGRKPETAGKGAIEELVEALSACRENGTGLIISTPRIARDSEMQYTAGLLKFAVSNDLPVSVSGIGTLYRARQDGVRDIYGDFPLNIFNLQTLRLFEGFGISRAVVSPELRLEQITKISGQACIPLEAVVEGHLPLMVSEYCPQGSLIGGLTAASGCSSPCRREKYADAGLRDRLGLVFPVTHDRFCRTYVHNAKELSMIEDIYPLFKAGISGFRLETSIESPERAGFLISSWRREIDRFMPDPENYSPTAGIKERVSEESLAGLTKGHYYRGVE